MRQTLSIIFLLICANLASFAQMPKRVFVTLDVSGSMDGNKYVMANYAAQTISVLCDEADQVFLYYLGQKHVLSGKDSYKTLHKAFKSLPSTTRTYYEISDIKAFLEDYRQDPKYQDWLFIIGDGDWNWKAASSMYSSAISNFSTFLKDNDIQVCYLQTGNNLGETYSFTEFLESLHSPKVEIHKSDTSASSVSSQCRAYANKILGFSNTSVTVNQENSSTLSFKSEFPLDRFLLLYQTVGSTPKLVSLSFGSTKIDFSQRGTPTTSPLVGKGASVLSGYVWEANYPTTIPANETITATFEGNIDKDKLTFYPYVDVVLNLRPHTVAGSILNARADGAYEICEKEAQVLVKLELTDKHGVKFTPPIMAKTQVRIKLGSNEAAATYESSDTSFHCVLQMPKDSISYHAIIESPGYFTRVSPKQTVVKADVCPRDMEPLIQLPEQVFPAVPYSSLENGDSFAGEVDDALLLALLNEGTFNDISFSQKGGSYFEESSLEMNANRLSFGDYPPTKELCECAFSNQLQFEVIIRSTEGILYDDKLYQGFRVPVTVPIDKREWLPRCKWVLICLGALLLLLAYMKGLTHKRRFSKTAKIDEFYTESYTEEHYGSKHLRKKGFSHWFSRWFNPFTSEKSSHKFNASVEASFQFEATEGPNTILISSSNYKEDTMYLEGYVPTDRKKEKQIRWMRGKSLELSDGSQKGRLHYLVSIKGDDIGRYKVFLGILKVIVILLIAFLIYIIFKSI